MVSWRCEARIGEWAKRGSGPPRRFTCYDAAEAGQHCNDERPTLNERMGETGFTLTTKYTKHTKGLLRAFERRTRQRRANTCLPLADSTSNIQLRRGLNFREKLHSRDIFKIRILGPYGCFICPGCCQDNAVRHWKTVFKTQP